MHRRYMAAAIRNHCRKDDPLNWGDQELIDSFALVPMPQVLFPEWSALVGSEPEEVTEIDPLDRLKQSGLIEKGIVTIS